MGYRDLARSIVNFGKEIQSDIKELEASRAKMDDLVAQGQLGYKQRDEKLAEMKREIIEKQARKESVYRNSAQSQYEAKLKEIESNHQSITQDDLAELTLLSQVEVTQEDINQYTNKYADKPLAMRKINALAKEKELMTVHQHDGKDDLDFINNKMNEYIDMFADNSKIIEPMTLNFTVDRIDEEMDYNLKLYENGIHKSE